ncbi:MAG: (Fe-S)-binding protein [Chloroflexota bacterium]
MPEAEYTLLDDDTWEELIQLTDGAAALCYQCGVCTAACPWGLVRDQPLSVRTLMRQAQLGLCNGDESLWLCTTCAQCEPYCPRGVHIADVFRGLRAIAWERRAVEPGLPSLLWSIFWNDNPWSQPPTQRSAWAKNLDLPGKLPAFDPQVHEILLYVGCTASYDRRAQQIARALARVLHTAGVSFGYLGDDEPCCGEAALSVGHKPYFQEIAQATTQRLQGKGVTCLVTVSPHCYDVFKNHYPSPDGQPAFTALHYTQYLAQLLEQGRLKFPASQPARRVTFQDPCYLGRHNQEYAAPRQVLSAIPGLELVEMPHSQVDGLCCGGGGGRMWLETAPGERFSDLRVSEAAQTAPLLVTACPFCIVCLEDSAKLAKLEHLAVLDVAEIASMALASNHDPHLVGAHGVCPDPAINHDPHP